MSDDGLDILARARALVAERNLSDAERQSLVAQLRLVAQLPSYGGFSAGVVRHCRRLADELEQPTSRKRSR